MSWNYRILDFGDHLSLHEVYYDKDGNSNAWTENAICFSCDPEEGRNGIINSLELALEAVKKYRILKVVGDKLIEIEE